MLVIKQSEVNIGEIVKALKQGKVIVYPTETCYGLGCDATNQSAVKKLFAIKHREENKPVLVLVSDIEMSKKYVQWSPMLEEMARKYWPGPLTIVAKVKNQNTGLSAGVLGKDNTVAFRISSHPFAGDLTKSLGCPLVSTSANITAQASPYDILSVREMFNRTGLARRGSGAEPAEPDLVIDSGELPFCKPSTIVRIVSDKMEVLRQGEVKI